MLPLSNLKVIALDQYAAGPYASMILADLGADVVKVELPEVGEPFRSFGGGYEAAYFVANNRNKKSIAIDLKSEDGKEILLKLLKGSDIFVENFGFGVADRLGFAYQVVSELNPRLIYCSIKGYGEGPYEARPAFDPVIEAESGFMTTTGEPGQPPVRLGGPVIDYVAGTFGVIAIMASLRNREKTGKGEKIEVNLFESAVSMLSQLLNEYAVYGYLPEKLGSGWGGYQAFEAKDGYVFVGIMSDGHWRRFCDSFNVSDDVRLEFATRLIRDEKHESLEKVVAGIVSTMSVHEVVTKLTMAKVPGAPVNTMKDVLEDPHLQFRKSIVYLTSDVEVTCTETEKSAACPMLPIRTSYYHPGITERWIPAQKLGAHTVELLREVGYSDDEILDLRKRKVVWPYL